MRTKESRRSQVGLGEDTEVSRGPEIGPLAAIEPLPLASSDNSLDPPSGNSSKQIPGVPQYPRQQEQPGLSPETQSMCFAEITGKSMLKIGIPIMEFIPEALETVIKLLMPLN